MASVDTTPARHRGSVARPRRGLAALAVLGLVSVTGAAAAGPEPTAPRTAALSTPADPDVPAGRTVAMQKPEVSRSGTRTPPVPEAPESQPGAVARAIGDVKVSRSDIADRLFMTAALNVWSGPGEQHVWLETLPAGTRIAVTGRVVGGQWAEVSYGGLSRWVNADYLSEDKPAREIDRPEEAADDRDESTGAPEDTQGGLSTAPCATGSDVEVGLTPDAIAVHRAVCAAFPQVSVYGGLRSDGEHGEGRALDIMITGSVGDQIAEYTRANAGALGVSEVIWAQRIWTVERSSEGWRYLEDRGSVTANHFDHVHVTVYGSSSG